MALQSSLLLTPCSRDLNLRLAQCRHGLKAISPLSTCATAASSPTPSYTTTVSLQQHAHQRSSIDRGLPDARLADHAAGFGGSSAAPASGSAPPAQASGPSVTQLRADLGASHAATAQLTSQLRTTELELRETRAAASAAATQLAALHRLKTTLERKLRDRDEELREKARLVEQVQDEMVGLEMQFNVAEDKAETLKAENADLIARWMKRVAGEADDMNRRGGFHDEAV